MIKFSAVALLATFGIAGSVGAANLLLNPNLDSPGTHDSDLINDWTLIETRTGPNNLPPANSATFASFANHNTGGTVGLWFRSFSGNLTDPVHADLFQDVAGTPGTLYRLSAWARYETNYPGGVAGDPQDTFLAIDFLDVNGLPISTSSIELQADGQTNGGGWMQHFVTGLAPAGTIGVRARGSMTNGHVATANPQSAFMDEFNLEVVVPEPVSLSALAFGGLMLRRRRA